MTQVTEFNTQDDIYSREFNTIDVSSTIGEWVDAFNNNALASTDHTWYLGEMLYNGLLYTGRETIGGQTAVPFVNLNISSVPISELVLDNLYLYFRDINKIKLINQKTFDLSQYDTSHPMFFYINSSLGFRVSQEFNQAANEIMLFRFIIHNGVFSQCYLTAQRFGSNVYDSAKEFYTVQGCQPLPGGAGHLLSLKLDDGQIKRSGIEINDHQIPDIHEIEDNDIPYDLRYITVNNEVDYTANTVSEVDSTQYLNYTTHTLSTVPNNKFTAQRILFDVYTNCLIMQYGDSVFDTMQDALSSLDNMRYPFPYGTLMYIPLGIMFIKKGATDLGDPDECILVQHLNTTVTNTDSAFFAEDSYARGRINAIVNDVTAAQQMAQNASDAVNAHIANTSNPHSVTKAQVGLGNVDNYSYNTIKTNIQTDLGDNWIKKNVADTTTGKVTFNGGLEVGSSQELDAKNQYILVNGQRLYVGVNPADIPNAPNGSWAIYN